MNLYEIRIVNYIFQEMLELELVKGIIVSVDKVFGVIFMFTRKVIKLIE